ncbi:MAG: SEC-C domain-containing protein [Armatimonadetes bacterium]|nr:SEC-C domain-containing protein [Armatimonadota bacterium]
MAEIERSWLLRIVNQRWMDHLQEMDYLRDGIYLRAHGQLDPFIEYNKEAAAYFDALLDHIAADMTRALLLTEVVARQQDVDHGSLRESTLEEIDAEMRLAGYGAVQYRAQPKPRRNDPCPCGSGKKYKYCCMLEAQARASSGPK